MATSATPSANAEADGTAGHNAVGNAQIRAVMRRGDTRSVTVDGQRTEAVSTTYNTDAKGRDAADSKMTYASPQTGAQVSSTITGFLSVRYRLTVPNGDTVEQQGVMIQMKNGDMFFRSSKDALPQWDGITALRPVTILSADPFGQNTYVATISFRPTIHVLPINCFASGTAIATPSGLRAVERIGGTIRS